MDMNRVIKSAVLSAMVAATTLTALPAAQAGDGWKHRHWHRGGHGDAVAAGILGLAVGALAVGIATNNDRYYEPGYREVRPRPRPDRNYYVRDPDVVYLDSSLEPWTVGWYEYCEDRYRTFDPGTGTFMGYDGREHFCVAR